MAFATKTGTAYWFHRDNIVDRMVRSSKSVAKRFRVNVGQKSDDVVTGLSGWCNSREGKIWVNPFALYKFAGATEDDLRLVTTGPGNAYSANLNLLKGHSGSTYDAMRTLRTSLGVTVQDEFIVTQFVTFHERGHEAFTNLTEEATGPKIDGRIHQVWNVLEDERMERLLSSRWSRVGWYIREALTILFKVGHKQWEDEMVNAPHPGLATINSVLWLRFALRSGNAYTFDDVKRFLTVDAHPLLDQIKPLVLEAWNEAPNANRVWEISEEIMKILEIHPDQMPTISCEILQGQGGMEGDAGGEENGENPDARDASGGLGVMEVPPDSPDDLPKPEDARGKSKGDSEDGDEDGSGGDVTQRPSPGTSAGSRGKMGRRQMGLPDSKELEVTESQAYTNYWGGQTLYGNYHDIMADGKLREGADRIRDAFKLPDPLDCSSVTPSEWSGRLKPRQYRRNPDKPFLRRFNEPEKPRDTYCQILIDRSSSMNSGTGHKAPIEYARDTAVMVGVGLRDSDLVKLDIWLMPGGQNVIAHEDDIEVGLGRAAGIYGSGGTQYAPEIRNAQTRFDEHRDHARVLFCIADGEVWGGDAGETLKAIEEMRDEGVIVKGIGIGTDNMQGLKACFGKEHFEQIHDVGELVPLVERWLEAFGEHEYSERRVW